jgi:hypothetical protein
MTEDPTNFVIRAILDQSRLKPDQIYLNARLLHDLGIDGDDGTELILNISKRFPMDLSGYDESQYFCNEPTILDWLWFLPYHMQNRPSAKRPLTVQQLIDAVIKGKLP